MNSTNPVVDKYLIDGCMRCKYGGTPKCKVNDWREELETLRQIVLKSGLKEEIKWGVPCYTFKGKNVINISAFKEYACVSFFKGSLLTDSNKILFKHGENSQAVRTIKFTNPEQIIEQKDLIAAYIQEAIALEESGKKVEFKKNPEPMPEELIEAFGDDLEFKSAFHALTPGRQRGYIIYFSQPKSAASKVKRIEKCKPNILKGIGLHDKYSC